MLRCFLILFLAFGLCGQALRAENEAINVYPAVPDLEPSEFYSFRVRTVGAEAWLTPHAFITRCKPSPEYDSTKYYSRWMGDWSNTYINFEMEASTAVEVEISRVGGEPITKAVSHPGHRVVSTKVVDGKAYVTLTEPTLFTVDIDGQMDDQDTSRILPSGWTDASFYSGPPIHTVTIFANPVIADKPDPADPNVLAVQPGVPPPDTGDWDTLYFLPGVHDVGLDFTLHKDRQYYIPGDAIVHGTFNNDGDFADGANIRIFGHGTISGERIPHPDDDPDPPVDATDSLYKPIEIAGAKNVQIEGITISDSAHHSLMLIGAYQPELPNTIRWVKIFTWRANGDGINPFNNNLIEDCFIRTADDCTYVDGLGIRRVVLWTDVNGSAFTLSRIGTLTGTKSIVVEDCDVLYNRRVFIGGSRGGRVFNLRGEGGGAGGPNVIFRDIRVHDPRPTSAAFNIATAAAWEVAPDYSQVRDPGDITGIRFENIQIAALSLLDQPETLWGTADAQLREFEFVNVSIAGEFLDDLSDFNHNEHVSNMSFFQQSEAELIADTFEDGAIGLAPSADDANGGFDATLSPGSDPFVRAYEADGNATLDLAGASSDLPYAALVSKSAFDATTRDALNLRVKVDSLQAGYSWTRPFAINLRPENSVEPASYDPNDAYPLGLTLMIGNAEGSDCRARLVANDGTSADLLWEDLEVEQAELADGFTVTLALDRETGWSIAFEDAASLPPSLSDAWQNAAWDDLFSETTHLQLSLREDTLETDAKTGLARADIASVELFYERSMTDYETWTTRFWPAGLPVFAEPSADHDLGGQPTGIEWLAGTDPTTTVDDAGTGIGYADDPDYHVFSYRRAQTVFEDPNTLITLEYQDGLAGDWQVAVADGATILFAVTADAYGSGFDKVEAKFLKSAFSEDLFVRLLVQPNGAPQL